MECEDLGKAISCCYCYLPVAPMVLERAKWAKDDPRPTGSGYFAARSEGVQVYDKPPELYGVGGDGWVMVYPSPVVEKLLLKKRKKRKGGGRSKATKLASSSGTDRPNPLGIWAPRRF